MSARTNSRKLLAVQDETLIAACKVERERLKKQYAELSDRALAKKFNVSHRTIGRV